MNLKQSLITDIQDEISNYSYVYRFIIQNSKNVMSFKKLVDLQGELVLKCKLCFKGINSIKFLFKIFF